MPIYMYTCLWIFWYVSTCITTCNYKSYHNNDDIVYLLELLLEQDWYYKQNKMKENGTPQYERSQ
jgi:hypothetical protein